MNKNDSDLIYQLLINENYLPALNPLEADVILINTCSVREHAEKRALGYISAFRQWHKSDGRILGIVGCMARRLGNSIFVKFPFVDLVLGPDSYLNIPDYLKLLEQERTKILDIEVGERCYKDIGRKSKRVAEFVSITRGCNNFCSYCVVPYVRGRLRSRPADDIISEVKNLTQCGVKDITLLGQNVNEYYYDGIDFPELLRKVAQETGIFRLRFLTSHPKDFSARIIEVIKENQNVCEWFHLPLQSGNNRILKLMNRKYTGEDYRNLIEKIRKNIPEATITTDIIVGFPTETESEFRDTLHLVEEIEFDDAYMYRYSPRPNVLASMYPALPEECIIERLKILIELQNKIIKKKTLKMVGKKYEVLFEERAKNGTRGKTRGNKDVVVEKILNPGSVSWIRIIRVKGRTPLGEIVEDDKSG